MSRRPGYTLLEVILAVAIGLLLVAALYVALDVQLRYMQTGRVAVTEGQLARGLLTRIAADVRLSMALLPTNSAGNGSSNSSSSPTSGSAEEESDLGTNKFNFGILGNEYQMTLFMSTVPRHGRMDLETQSGISDLRRVTYYFVSGEGLARQEIAQVTAADAESQVAPVILANEVVGLQFRYYDAVNAQWLPQWDGTQSGPPLAVEIVMTIRPPVDTSSGTVLQMRDTQYRAVVAIPSASIPQEAVNTQGGAMP